MSNDIIWQAVRYTLIAAGFWMSARNWIPVDQVASTVDRLMQFGSLAMSTGTMLWGFYVKFRTKSVPLATAKRIDVPTVHPATGAIEAPLEKY